MDLNRIFSLLLSGKHGGRYMGRIGNVERENAIRITPIEGGGFDYVIGAFLHNKNTSYIYILSFRRSDVVAVLVLIVVLFVFLFCLR